MNGSSHIPHDDLALFAMQALTPDEAATVREHVRTCAPCRAELAMLEGDLALVAMSVEQHPIPAGARDRFLARIAADAPPQTAPNKTDDRVNARVVSIDTPRRKSAFTTWVPWLAAAALIVLAIGQQLQVRSLHDQVTQQAELLQQQQSANARAQAVLNLLSAPTAQHVMLTAAKTPPAPSAKAVYLASSGSLLMQASNLQAVPQNKTYELWIIPTSGAPIPAGTFRPDAAGNASVVLPDLPKGVQAKAFGVTIENAGGSTAPTMPIVLAGAAPAAGE
ncbi:MAG TPA: anti-sigma factor [Terracidiphilus sp.]|jgi:anti-sigma-K factor RskA